MYCLSMNNTIQDLITKYLDSKTNAWAPTTLKSERYRLNAVAPHLDGNPLSLWAAISDRGPYTRVTIWTRVTDFYQWCLDNGHRTGPNHYRTWKEDNARQFKHAYTPRFPEISFEEARARIQKIPQEGIRNKAMELLLGGLRYTESFTFREEDSTVVGKGSKRRVAFIPKREGASFNRTYATFLRALRKVGLTPHQLRKLAATEFARRGLREADLCKVMGWSSFATASKYIAPLKDEEIRSKIETVQHGGTNATTTIALKPIS